MRPFPFRPPSHFVSPFLLLPLSSNGFVLFCPCMGRFGNQMEQFLGVFAFAKSLNRTLVLPPLINYPPGAAEAEMVEFDKFFLVSPVAQFHRIVLLRDFMNGISKIWPVEKRKVLCWSPRPGLANPSQLGCHATEGNPFGPFWRYAGIDFAGDEFFGLRTGGFHTERDQIRRKWETEFPVRSSPVLAFSSPPAAFPVRPEHRFIQRFVQWNGQIMQKAAEFVARNFGPGKDFVGIHLRNGRDWENVCQLLREGGKRPTDRGRKLFASDQCTGPDGEYGPLTEEACDPSMDTILEELRSHVVRLSASAVFVASDRSHHLARIGAHLAKTVRWPVTVAAWTKQSGGGGGGGNVPVELALLGMADHFIANCVSTFSAFVVRQRHFGNGPMQRHRRSVSFLAFPHAAMELLPGGTKRAERNNEL